MSFDTLNHNNIVAFIADILARRGDDSYMGEAVTMSQHMLQTAALAQKANASKALVAASLLHDIGHYTNEFPEDALACGQDNYHETAGADVLKTFFPKSVTEPIELHVAAKRYLCAVNDKYFSRLSAASVQSLKVQGGPMNAEEVETFRTHEYYEDALRLRAWDDEGKVAGVHTPAFADFAPSLEHLTQQHAAATVTP